MQLSGTNNKPQLKAVNKKPTPEKIKIIITNLQKRNPTNRPGTYKTLLSTVRSIFQNTLSEKEPDNLIKALINRKMLTVSDTKKVAYTFPKL
jgi:hypothetical protein